VITYVTTNMSQEARISYLPKYFDSLLTAAVLNKGTFTEANSFSCVGVLIPPGSRVDNPFTLLQSGLIGMLWNLGFGGYQVTLPVHSRVHSLIGAENVTRIYTII
jgi:hypothetical protein